MSETSQDQTAELIELLAISGWTLTINYRLTGAQPWRVEGKHSRYVTATVQEGPTLVDALYPFEIELPIAMQRSLMARRRERSAAFEAEVKPPIERFRLLITCTSQSHPVERMLDVTEVEAFRQAAIELKAGAMHVVVQKQTNVIGAFVQIAELRFNEAQQ